MISALDLGVTICVRDMAGEAVKGTTGMRVRMGDVRFGTW